MKIDNLDPLLDPRWDQLVASHPSASVFHTTRLAQGFSQDLRLSAYGADKLREPAQPLSDGVVFCEVRSSFTGARLISLPFSDHAQPLMNESGDPLELQQWMEAEYIRGQWKYIELRPIAMGDGSRFVIGCDGIVLGAHPGFDAFARQNIPQSA